MKFTANSRRRAAEYEPDLVRYWKDNRTFEKSVAQRPTDDAFVFYDGPPFITGIPHTGTLLSSIVKDAVPRFQTMRGKRVERVWGWDCHGLPAEVFTEKKLGIHDRRDIGTKISLEQYITTCRANMVQTGSEWEDTIARVGRWVDFTGAYKTMDKDFMESVWWAFKQLYDKGKIYEGEKVLLYCVRDATPISKAEVAMDNSYQEVTDPSVYVKFKLRDYYAALGEDDKNSTQVYALAWTTTPWTLPANTALAVNKKLMYSEVALPDGTHLIVAADRLASVLRDDKHQPLRYSVVRQVSGEQLAGLSYEPLLDADRGANAHRVWAADHVSADDGSGIVHIAPAFGEEDYALAREHDIPLVNNLDDSGIYTEGEWQGQQVWEANKPVAKALRERGIVWRIEYLRHSYPHCHRCGTKLIYRAHPSWFMDIAGQRAAMLEQNQAIGWTPAHLKHGRFAHTVATAPDWNLSRDRFWATAMPVWKGVDASGTTHVKVVGSYDELEELSGRRLEDYHRPWIDDVTFELDGVHYERIDRVLDCWFESGSMPFAQFHYPFENKAKFERNFPGDFIAEYVGQVRAWFYYVHAVNVGLFGQAAFKNVAVTGTLSGDDGRKMSKSYGNYTDPNELMDKYGADALRFLLLSSPLLNGEDFSLHDKDVANVQRKLAMVWNMYDFFTMYAAVDGWEWQGGMAPPENLHHPLDRWIISRLHQLQQHITTEMSNFDIAFALSEVLPFLDDASNWYVRRSRRRFWKSGDDADKQAAYRTLHYVLVRLSQLLAPFTPFLAEELFRNLTGGESVHLTDWPEPGSIDEPLIADMRRIRESVTDGLAQRAKAGLKVRQPLARAELRLPKLPDEQAFFEAIIRDELNVKQVVLQIGNDQNVVFDTTITDELRGEGLARELIRHVQSARKQAGLQVDDRIDLSVSSDDPVLRRALREHRALIEAEVLATGKVPADGAYTTAVKVEGASASISLARAAEG